jgi:hypothetical protein
VSDPISLVEWDGECGVEWESGEPARHHICVRRKGHGGGVHRCLCGEEVEGDAV